MSNKMLSYVSCLCYPSKNLVRIKTLNMTRIQMEMIHILTIAFQCLSIDLSPNESAIFQDSDTVHYISRPKKTELPSCRSSPWTDNIHSSSLARYPILWFCQLLNSTLLDTLLQLGLSYRNS